MDEARKRIAQITQNHIEIKANSNSVDVIDDVSNFALFLTTRVMLGSLLKGTVINCCADSTPNYHWTKFKVFFELLVQQGMPADALVFLAVDGPVGKQYIMREKMQSNDHKWITCSQFIADLSRKAMRFPENFHASTSGLNSLVNFEVPTEATIQDQAFCVNFEGSKQCTTTGSTGLFVPSFSLAEAHKYADVLVNKLRLAPLVDNVYDALEK